MQQAMSTVEGKKQEKRRALLDAAYELFLERGTSKTSVEDITSRAKVGKGTFYLYFADKGSVTQALLARVSYQLLDNACAAAEQYAAEDAKRKEEIDTRNQGDQMVYQTERTLEELGDKVDAAEKAEVESKLNELKETLKGSDTAAIKAATEALTQVFYKLSEKMYQQANPQGGQPGANPGCDPNCQGGDCGNGGDNGQQYYDADYTVVDDDKK